MSDRVLFISKNCQHSSKLLVGLHKHQLLNHFRVIDVSSIPREQIPPYVQSVPCLVYGTIRLRVTNYLNI